MAPTRAGTGIVTRALPDALLWAALAVPGVAADLLGLNAPRAWWQTAAGAAVLAAAVAVSRARPVLALGLAAGLGLAASPSLFTLSYGPALSVLAFLLGRRSARTRPVLYAFPAVAAAGTVLVLVRHADPVIEWLVLIGTLLFGAVFPWLAGRYRRQARELVAAGWSRAAQLEREQEIVADRARLRERARIAQDMHDSLGHELSLIALRAGALQVAPGLDAAHRAAAADLREAAATATDRLRDIIGVLRDAAPPGPAPLAPPDDSLPALVDRAAASGLRVRASLPSEAALPPLVERAAYRVVQEALTNAAKHAPGAEVAVTVATGARETEVTVVSGPAAEGGTPSASGSGSGSGTGLLGLRERVALAGGEFTAGAAGDDGGFGGGFGGGFRVRARLPHDPGPRAGLPGAARDGHAARPEEPAAMDGGRDTDALAHARRTARRRFAVPFAVAAAGGAVFVAAAFGWYAYIKAHSVLKPADYAAMRVGAPYADVAPLLPDRQVADPPSDRDPATPPAGAECRYYRASGELFVSVEHFRLCFRDGHLVAKSRIPRVGAAGVVEQEEKEWLR
ncbi:ATP-binding protein [Streptosporangium nondiastaticum]|uniref:histidine kinase n=1 Tax=Streptosporangium nondiastaticum TaxID=35764 RepID=A0A9X7JK88_9ACTN|nr:ATP-binding protein [Streptosporangium nondiastaticum]